MDASCIYDCASQPKKVAPYSDIAGIGVTYAFLVAANMVVATLLVYYLVLFDPRLDPFRREGNTNLGCQHPNSVDQMFLDIVRIFTAKITRKLGHSLGSGDGNNHSWSMTRIFPKYRHLEPALNNSVLTLADIQIFSGLALMISGYKALSCGLSAYHWKLLVHLAWLGSTTYFSMLSFLRTYLFNNPWKLYWRTILIGIILLLNIPAVVLTGHFEWDDEDDHGPKPADHAGCYWGHHPKVGTEAWEAMVITVLLLIYGYVVRLVKMWKRADKSLRQWATKHRKKLAELSARSKGDVMAEGNSLSNWVSNEGIWSHSYIYMVFKPFCIALVNFFQVHLEILTSFLAEIFWLLMAVIWGSRRMFAIRSHGPDEDNEWTFGQVFPLVLLIAPVIAVLEHICTCQNRSALGTGTQRTRQGAHRAAEEPGPSQPEVSDTYDLEFRLFFIAALPYIEAGYLFQLLANSASFQTLLAFMYSFLVVNPILFLFWVVYKLWTKRMPEQGRLAGFSDQVCFALLCSLSINDFFTSPNQVSIRAIIESTIPIGILSAFYISSAVVYLIGTGVYGNDATKRRLFYILGGFFVTVGMVLWHFGTASSDRRLPLFVFAISIGCTVVSLLLEFIIAADGILYVARRIFTVFIFGLLIVLAFVDLKWETGEPNFSGTRFIATSTLSVFAFLAVIWNTVALVSESLQRNAA